MKKKGEQKKQSKTKKKQQKKNHRQQKIFHIENSQEMFTNQKYI